MKDFGQLEQLVNEFGGGSQSSFARTSGILQSTINTWMTRKNFAPERIKHALPQIDGNWLLTGEGEMLLPEDGSSSVHVSGHHNTAQVNSSGSLEVSNYGASDTSETEKDVQLLKQEISSLNALLAEKERLINVLLDRK